MNLNLWIYYAIYVWLVIPLLLLYTAWRKNAGEKITSVLLIMSAVFLLSSTSTPMNRGGAAGFEVPGAGDLDTQVSGPLGI